MIVLAGWYAHVVDVCGAFLLGTFKPGVKLIYMEVPQGSEWFYLADYGLLLLQTLYGLKQAAWAFWKCLLEVLCKLQYKHNAANPCVYFRWLNDGTLNIWSSWVNDMLNAGAKSGVMTAVEQFKKQFKCDDVGELREYVGCKIEIKYEKRYAKLTQPVLLQSLQDEFVLPEGEAPATPAVPGNVFEPIKGKPLQSRLQKINRKGIGKLLHLMKWSRPESMNAVCEESWFMTEAGLEHNDTMYRTMKYMLNSPDQGWVLAPNAMWDVTKNFEFEISGVSDSDFAKDPIQGQSVSGYVVYLNGAPVSIKSKMQECNTTSVRRLNWLLEPIVCRTCCLSCACWSQWN